MKYIVNCEKKFFVRNDGLTTVIMIKDNGEEFILNKTGHSIFNCILKNTDSEDVIKEIRNLYKFENIDLLHQLTQDINDILNLMEIYDIIKIDKVNVKSDLNKKICAIGEDDYINIRDFIIKNKEKDSIVFGDNNYYRPQNIRYRVMNNIEYTYCIRENNLYHCVASVMPNLKQSSVVVLSTLVINRNLSSNDRIKYSQEILNYIFKNMINKVNKIRFSYFADPDSSQPEFVNSLLNIGFSFECKLEKEFGDRDLMMYMCKF